MAERAKSRMQTVRERLTYANVMSTIAAFLGLGTGGAVAVDKLSKNSVGDEQIKAGAVRSAEVKDRSLKQRDLAGNSVGGSQIRTGAVDGSDVLDGTLGAADIRDGGLGPRNLGFQVLTPGGVGASDMIDGSLGTADIRDGGIGEQDLSFQTLKPGGVGATDVIDESLGTADIRDGSVGEQDLSFKAFKAGSISSDGVLLGSKLSLTANYATVASTTVTAGGIGLLSLGSINLENTAAGESTRVYYQILVDGLPQGSEFVQDLEPGQQVAAPVALIAPSATPGAHTVEVQARVTIGSALVNARNLGVVAGIRACCIE